MRSAESPARGKVEGSIPAAPTTNPSIDMTTQRQSLARPMSAPVSQQMLPLIVLRNAPTISFRSSR